MGLKKSGVLLATPSPPEVEFDSVSTSISRAIFIKNWLAWTYG